MYVVLVFCGFAVQCAIYVSEHFGPSQADDVLCDRVQSPWQHVCVVVAEIFQITSNRQWHRRTHDSNRIQ